jgi:hypothetical protein
MKKNIRETIYPKIRIKTEICDWTPQKIAQRDKNYEKTLNDWEALEKEYKLQIQEIPQYKTEIEVQVEILEKLVSNCIYNPSELHWVKADKWEARWKNIKVGDVIDAAFYVGKILEIKEIKEEYKKTVYPEWQLPDRPKKPYISDALDAAFQCQKLIRSVCPHARWDGTWNYRPSMLGYLDVTQTKTSEIYLGSTVWVEKGTQYLVEVDEQLQQLVLSKQQIERYYYEYTSGDGVGYVGLGSWSDKGYC